MTKIDEEDIVICKVSKVEGTNVFVDLPDFDMKGSIVLSEVSAGRIRNLRDFVSPGKKIVCKVLKVYPDHLELSLRRVTAKEKTIALEREKKESTFKKIISSVSKESEKIIDEIKKKFEELSDFIEEIKEAPEKLEEFFSKEESSKIQKIISEKPASEKLVKKIFILKSHSSSGLNDIQFVLSEHESFIRYLGSSKFSLITTGTDFKEAETKSSEILEKIKEEAKKKGLKLEIQSKQK